MTDKRELPLPPPREKGTKISAETKQWFYMAVKKGEHWAEAGELANINRSAARRLVEKLENPDLEVRKHSGMRGGSFKKEDDTTVTDIARSFAESNEQTPYQGLGQITGPKSKDELPKRALKAYNEFGYHRYRYLNRRNIAWQIEMCHTLMSWYEWAQNNNERVRGILTTPPGGGKTTTVTHDFPLWLISRNRSVRIGLGSKTTSQATAYTRRLRNTLEKNTLLNVEFGRFKPEKQDKEMWRQDRYIVDGVTGKAASLSYKLALAGFDADNPLVQERLEDPKDEIHEMIEAVAEVYLTGEKEPTVQALSYQMGFLGGRFDFNLWDDLVDTSNSQKPEQRDSLAEWWEEYAVSRCEPGGIVALIGTRMGRYDLDRKSVV